MRGRGETKERTEKEEQWGEARIKKRRTCGKRGVKKVKRG